VLELLGLKGRRHSEKYRENYVRGRTLCPASAGFNPFEFLCLQPVESDDAEGFKLLDR